MCNLYRSVPPADLVAEFKLRSLAATPYADTLAPLKPGPYVKAGGEGEVGQWGMIPPGSPTRVPMARGRRLSTNNCRRETMGQAWTFRRAWASGQRCLIPAWSFDEPYWGTGRNIWWRFARADGTPWALAGLWSEWTDPETGEVVPNYTLITQNCDGHPVLGRMHKPDPKLPADGQDKRAVVPIERGDWDVWLQGSPTQALGLIRTPPAHRLRHGPADPALAVPPQMADTHATSFPSPP